jgi:hypothetical protein
MSRAETNPTKLDAPIEASPFRAAYAELMQARATYTALDAASQGDPDNPLDEAVVALKAAEWKLLQTPATGIVDIRYRAMVVQEMFGEAAWGKPTDANLSAQSADRRRQLMLAALIHEILSPVAED